MKLARRNFCKMALTVPAGLLAARVGYPKDIHLWDDPVGYYYHGKDRDYIDFKIIDEGLKIVRVETFTVPKVGVVRITTDDGSVGYGQISPHDAEFTTMILHDKIAKRFLSKDPAYIDALVDGCIDANYKFPGTYICRALTGLDTAIWDLYGKIKHKPVAELLGGSICDIPVYGSSMSREIPLGDEASRMAALRDQYGYTAFKLRVGKKTARMKINGPADRKNWYLLSEKRWVII